MTEGGPGSAGPASRWLRARRATAGALRASRAGWGTLVGAAAAEPKTRSKTEVKDKRGVGGAPAVPSKQTERKGYAPPPPWRPRRVHPPSQWTAALSLR